MKRPEGVQDAQGRTMGGTYTQLYYHFVFSTKHRERRLTDTVRPHLYDYFGGIIRSTGGMLDEAGGTDDHVHLLARGHPDVKISELMRQVKGSSSKWLVTAHDFPCGPKWQDGYAAFTVSASQCDRLRAYIRGQEKHHEKQSFQDELRELLRKHGVEFDERYIWD